MANNTIKQDKIIVKANKMADIDLFIWSEWFQKFWVWTIAAQLDQIRKKIITFKKPDGMSVEDYWLEMAVLTRTYETLNQACQLPFKTLKMIKMSIDTLGTSE